MKKLLAVGLLAAAVLAAGAPARAVEADDVKRAVGRGVEALRRMQQEGSGRWPHAQIGMTALAGLTLLECGASADDKAVQLAAAAVRREGVGMTKTYSIALSILFLNRLGDRKDVPLIESLMIRLLNGQTGGGWSYDCPALSAEDAQQLRKVLGQDKEAADGRGRDGWVPGGGFAGGGLPVPPDARGPIILEGGDNSNTQFATLAMWVGRRHGPSIRRALTRVNDRFRSSQMEDGGWPYVIPRGLPGVPGGAGGPMRWGPGGASTASMTCAGLLCLAIADGATLEVAKDGKGGAKRAPDIGKDPHMTKGLQALGAIIGDPKGLRLQPTGGPPNFRRPQESGRVGGGTYYFLWSLERVGVALSLDTIGKKDWYNWGAEILLDNQQTDGSWRGTYGEYGADTCFALLFLKRSNLAGDLTAALKGKLRDPGDRLIRAGGVGGSSLRGGTGGLRSGIETKEARPIDKPVQMTRPVNSESARLADDLVKASGAGRAKMLDKLRDGKGVKYTEALAAAIPQLEGDPRHQARDALAARLTRMKTETLAEYLQDDDAEIRRAAALACAMKGDKASVPHLIGLLRDPEMLVVRAAHAALKELTGRDFGPSAKAGREERDQAVLKWLRWWNQQKK